MTLGHRTTKIAMPEENQAPPAEAATPTPESPTDTKAADATPAPDGEAPAPKPRPPRPRPAAASAEGVAAEAPAPAEGGEAPARPARPKPGDAPAKPLPQYIQEDILPLLEKRMKAEGAADVALAAGEADFTATWDNGNKTFTIYFDEGNLEGRKTIAYNEVKSPGRVLQMFMPPERGFKGVDAKQIVVMILQQFTTTLTWVKKQPAATGAKKPKK